MGPGVLMSMSDLSIIRETNEKHKPVGGWKLLDHRRVRHPFFWGHALLECTIIHTTKWEVPNGRVANDFNFRNEN